MVTAKHILVVPHKDKAVELRQELDAFVGNFDRNLLIEVRAEQGLILVSNIHSTNCLIRDISYHGQKCEDGCRKEGAG